MKNRVGIVGAGSVVVVCLLALACCQPERRELYNPLSSSTGTLRLLLTDSPIEGNVDAITVKISRVDVVFAEDAIPHQTIIPENTTFNLLDLQNGVTAVLGIAELPVGIISQLRLIIDDASITVDGITSDLKIPSGENTGVKLDGEFEISPCFVTTVTIDFDAKKSVRQPPGLEHSSGCKYLLQPVISIVSVDSDFDHDSPVLSISEDHLITDQEVISFNVDMSDENMIDLDSFLAVLEGSNVSSSFSVTQSGAVSLPLSLTNIGTNELTVSVSDICGNQSEVSAYVYRGEPGELPDAFDVIEPGIGGEVSIDDPSSPAYGASVVIPPGAVETEQSVAIGHSTEYFDRPEGMVGIGPAIILETNNEFLENVTVTLPFSDDLMKFLRIEEDDLEVLKYSDATGWVRVGDETILPEGRLVQIETDSFSPLQVWAEYPTNLVVDTIAGGGNNWANADTIGLATDMRLLGPGTVSGIEGDFYLLVQNSYRSDGIYAMRTSGLFWNVVWSNEPDKGYTAVEGHNGSECEIGDICFYYGVATYFQNPMFPNVKEVAGEIRQSDLSGDHDIHIAGKMLGDIGEDVPAEDAQIGVVSGLEVDSSGNIYFSEVVPSYEYFYLYGERVRKIDKETNLIRTIAGTGVPGFNGDDGLATDIQLALPQEVVSMQVNGRLLFIADTFNWRIRAINISDSEYILGDPSKVEPIIIPSGHMVTVMGPGLAPIPGGWTCDTIPDGTLWKNVTLMLPTSLELIDDYLFVSDECNRIMIMSLKDLRVTTLAGTSDKPGIDGDGYTGISTELKGPYSLHYNSMRSQLIFPDRNHNSLRRLRYKWRIFVSPSGCDSSNDPNCAGKGPYDGSAGRPFKTIQRVHNYIQEIMEESPEPPPRDDIEVVIAPGTYYGHGNLCTNPEEDCRDQWGFPAEIIWNYTMPNHSIRLVAQDPDDPPVFAGCIPGDWCYSKVHEEYCRDCVDCCDEELRTKNLNYCHCWGNRGPDERRRIGEWMRVDSRNGESSNISFENLIVTGYQNGMDLRGGTARGVRLEQWSGDNRVLGCKFIDIGDGGVTDFERPGYPGVASFGGGAISMHNSRYNLIADNIFRSVENFTSEYDPGECPDGYGMECYIHGIYIMFNSHWNYIFHNVFQGITGNPIKIRDFSNFNTIKNNVFSKCGIEGAYFDHFEISSAREECPSYENYFEDNILDGSYRSCGNLSESDLRPRPSYWQACCYYEDNPWEPMPCEPCELSSSICEWPWERLYTQNNQPSGNNCLCSVNDVETVEHCKEILGL